MAPALRTITPTFLSFALPLVLRVHHVSLHPIFLPLAIYAFVAERGYRETLEWVTPEFSEHTGPFSHIGVCLLAHMFVQDAYGAHGWRGEVLFWSVWGRWGAGVCRAHRAGIDSFKEAYQARFKGSIKRVHAALVATALSPLFTTNGVGPVLVAIIWLHFYHCVGFMIASWNYCCLAKDRDVVVKDGCEPNGECDR